jgi:hypothetical protein
MGSAIDRLEREKLAGDGGARLICPRQCVAAQARAFTPLDSKHWRRSLED